MEDKTTADSPKSRQKLPTGLNWIRAILILGLIGVIVSLVLKNTIIPGVGIFQGLLGDIFLVISALIIVLVIFGISKRNENLYKLALIWFGLSLLVSIYSFATTYQVTDIFIALMQLLFIWYFLKRKNYFVHKEIPFNYEAPAVKRQEKILKIGVIIIIILAAASPRIFDMYRMVTVMPFGFAKMDVPALLEMCREKEPNDRDFCIYHVVEAKEDDYDFGNGEVCQEISSTDYKDGCYLLLYQCDKISDENTKKICQSLSSYIKK